MCFIPLSFSVVQLRCLLRWLGVFGRVVKVRLPVLQGKYVIVLSLDSCELLVPCLIFLVLFFVHSDSIFHHISPPHQPPHHNSSSSTPEAEVEGVRPKNRKREEERKNEKEERERGKRKGKEKEKEKRGLRKREKRTRKRKERRQETDNLPK